MNKILMKTTENAFRWNYHTLLKLFCCKYLNNTHHSSLVLDVLDVSLNGHLKQLCRLNGLFLPTFYETKLFNCDYFRNFSLDLSSSPMMIMWSVLVVFIFMLD